MDSCFRITSPVLQKILTSQKKRFLLSVFPSTWHCVWIMYTTWSCAHHFSEPTSAGVRALWQVSSLSLGAWPTFGHTSSCMPKPRVGHCWWARSGRILKGGPEISWSWPETKKQLNPALSPKHSDVHLDSDVITLSQAGPGGWRKWQVGVGAVSWCTTAYPSTQPTLSTHKHI